MKSAVVALLTIAAILLAFVFSMGIFFALIRPRATTTTYLYELMDGPSNSFEEADIIGIPEKAAIRSQFETDDVLIMHGGKQMRSPPKANEASIPLPPNLFRQRPKPRPSTTTFVQPIVTTERTIAPTKDDTTEPAIVSTEGKTTKPTTIVSTQATTTRPAILFNEDGTTKQATVSTKDVPVESTLVFTATTKAVRREEEQSNTVVFGGGSMTKAPALQRIRPQEASKVIRHGPLSAKEHRMILPPSPVIVNLQEEVYTLAPADEDEGDVDGLQQVHEREMTHYGKVVGLAYRDGLLYVGAHRAGKITVLSTPDLEFVEEFACENCRIYDMDTTKDGSLIVAQGMGRKLTKIDMATKKIVNEVNLKYETKGIAVSPEDIVFVMTRSHDKIYQYDLNLNEIGVIPFPNQAKDDCNFMEVARDAYELYLSCQSAIVIVDYSGNPLQRLTPTRGPHGSYSVGMAQDDEGNILAVRRGRSQIDIYRPDGVFVSRLGRRSDTLWSDLVVADKYAYVVDYLSATVKALKLKY